MSGVGHTFFARARIGVSAVDEDGLCTPVRHAFSIELDRGGLDNVGRKDAGRARRPIRGDQGNVLDPVALDPARESGCSIPLRGKQPAFLDFQSACPLAWLKQRAFDVTNRLPDTKVVLDERDSNVSLAVVAKSGRSGSGPARAT